MKRKKIFFLACMFVATDNCFAQESNKAILTGIIIDKSTRKPIEFTSVYIFQRADSSPVSNTVSESDGKFIIENIPPGDYLFACSFFGYEKRDSLISIAPGQKKINIGQFLLKSSSVTLKETVVSDEGGKLMNLSIDRKIYNVEKDIASSSGSASDVLKNIPSVEVDLDGGVTLRGSADVMILINGKVSPIMKGKTRAEALQQLPAGSIEKIEVITNPSAKYKPDGTSGIINIVLKKNIKSGMNGSITANAGNNDRYNGNTLISYKPGKLNVYAGAGLRQNRQKRYGDIDRKNLDSAAEVLSLYIEDNIASGKSFSGNVNAGMDYEMDTSNSISISGDFTHFRVDRNNVSSRHLFNNNNILEKHYERNTELRENTKEGEVTISYEHKFKKEEHTLEIELAGSSEAEREDSWYSNFFHLPVMPKVYDNVFVIKHDNPKEITADYAYPVSEDMSLDVGYSGTFNKIDINYRGERIDTTTGEFTKDVSTSYEYQYKDNINALYVTWEQGIEDFGFLAGLRLEQATLEGNLVTIDSVFKNNYLSLYPSLHLLYEMEAGEFQLNYSRRVNRPDGDDLNPFPEYDDPRNLYAGNAKLLPEYIHSAELGFEMKKDKFSFVPSLFYHYTYNGFTDVTERINDTILITRMQNLDKDQEAGLELILMGKPCKWLSGNLTGNIFYKQIDASNLGLGSNKSVVSSNTTLNANVMIAKNTMLQVNSRYRSAVLSPQGEFKPSFYLNVGAKHEFFKNKLALTITIADIFKSQRNQMELNTNYFTQVSVSRRDSRIVYVGLKYRFGTLTKKQKEEALQYDNTM